MKLKTPLVSSVLGIENPLMDFVGHVGFEAFEGLDVRPGTMNLVDEELMLRVLARLPSCETVPGGSCANTIRGIAWLRGSGSVPQTRYSGAIGDDEIGRSFESGLRECGVEPLLSRKHSRTGVSVILATPDHERTMFTYLGACREYGPDDLPARALDEVGLLYITGYLWDTEPQKAAARGAVEHVRRRGATVCLDVADPFVVSRYREEFLAWIPGRVDILFANRAELTLLVGGGERDDEITLRAAARFAPTVVMKVGKEGSLCLHPRGIERGAAVAARVVDTTGAGDAFAAGYLYAHLAGKGPAEAANLGNRVAAKVVGVEGCRYDALAREL
jgi:sugar/nucleoside kinase (ribokinase family)